MQALALALVACMAIWAMDRRGVVDPMLRYLKRVLWLLLAIYLLSPVAVFVWPSLPLLLM
jgi:hypothetical protein